jgi:hypothetical protein
LYSTVDQRVVLAAYEVISVADRVVPVAGVVVTESVPAAVDVHVAGGAVPVVEERFLWLQSSRSALVYYVNYV